MKELYLDPLLCDERMEEPYINPLWHLADVLALQDAAALIAGYDPSEIDRCRDDSNFREAYPDLYPVEKALDSAVRDGILESVGDVEYVWANDDGDWINTGHVHMQRSRVKVTDVCSWLSGRGFITGFFFPEETRGSTPEYLDPQNEKYAPKLSAAVNAWLAVTGDPDLVQSKTPKQALIKWLNENADRYGLTKDDGMPNEQGIEEISKVANWQLGGSSKTPG